MAAITTSKKVTDISEETTVIIVSTVVNQTLIPATKDPTQRRIETLVSSRAILP